MLSSFFSNSKTANYIILSLALPLILIVRFLTDTQKEPFLWNQLLALIGQVMILIFALLLVDFIFRKNKLTQPNTFGLWWFFCGLVTATDLGNLTQSLGLVVALLALRRVISIFNEQNLEKKIFDAGFWIFLVAAFYPWFVFLLAPLYFAIAKTNQSSWRYYLAPLMAGIALWLIQSAIVVLIPELREPVVLNSITFSASLAPLKWSWPMNLWLQLGFGAALLLLIISIVFLPLAHREVTGIRQAHLQLVWRIMILALAIAGFSANEKTEVFLWLILPLSAVLYANLIELRQPSLLREFFTIAPLVLPLVLLLLK